jgi:hypothetical protein
MVKRTPLKEETSGAEARAFQITYAALKGRSSTALQAFGNEAN